MTIRSNCVEYVFDMRTTTLAAATRHDFAAITLQIPENSSRTFRSVIVEITMRDSQVATASRGSVSSWLIGIKLGSVAFNDVTVTDTITDTGEQLTLRFQRDVTSYFATNFGAGASQTCQVGLQYAQTAGTLLFANITAKLIITYDYSDTGQTEFVKTVRIPIETVVGALTDTAPPPQIGTDQVPLLDTFCPEAGKTFRNICFEFFGNQSNGGTTATYLGVALDGAAETAFATVSNANNSSTWNYYTWNQNSMVTSSTHQLGARVNDVTSGPHNHIAILLTVTYTYSTTSTTRVLNSIMIPVDFNGPVPGTAATDRKRWRRSLYIAEPGTLTLRQSGVVLFWDAPSNANLLLSVGGQAFLTYTANAGSMTCGMFSLSQRIDSGGAQGAGITLAAAGSATDLYVDIYAATTNVLSNVSGWVYLNYESDLATSPGMHAHTVVKLLRATAADATFETVNAVTAIDIPESDYRVVGASLKMDVLQATAATFNSIEAELATGEGEEDGWRTLLADFRNSDAELGFGQCSAHAWDEFRRSPSDPDTDRMNIEGSRRWRISSSATAWKSLMSYVTYHGHTFAVTGTVSLSAGGTVSMALFDAATHELLNTGSRTGNGSYTINWYDARSVYVVAREADTQLMRSANGQGTRV